MLPVTHAQDHWLRERAYFRVPYVMKFRGSLNAELLRQAYLYTLWSHPVLRTRFEHKQTEFVVSGLDPIPSEVKELAFEYPSEDEAEDAVWLSLKHQFPKTETFKDPSVQATLFNLSARHHIFAGYLRHSVADETSVRFFFTHLLRNYVSLVTTGSLLDRAQSDDRYSTFAQEQERPEAKLLRLEAIEYWRKELMDYGSITLRGGRRAGQAEEPAKTIPFVLDNALFCGVQAASRLMGLPIAAVLLTAVSGAAKSYSGSNLPIRYAIAGRPSRFRDSAGCFMQHRPFVMSECTWKDAAASLTQARAAYISSTRLHNCIAHETLEKHNVGCISVNINSQTTVPAHAGPIPLPNASVEIAPLRRRLIDTTIVDMKIGGSIHPSGFYGHLSYAADTHPAESAQAFLAYIVEALRRLVAV